MIACFIDYKIFITLLYILISLLLVFSVEHLAIAESDKPTLQEYKRFALVIGNNFFILLISVLNIVFNDKAIKIHIKFY